MTTDKTTKPLPHLDEADLRLMFNLAHTHAVDTIVDCDETIAWHETPGRLSRRSLLRGHRDAWTDRDARAKREVEHARETRARYVAFVEKLEAAFAAEYDQSIADFAAAMKQRWQDAKRADRKAGK